jgi:hypothetical protein
MINLNINNNNNNITGFGFVWHSQHVTRDYTLVLSVTVAWKRLPTADVPLSSASAISFCSCYLTADSISAPTLLRLADGSRSPLISVRVRTSQKTPLATFPQFLLAHIVLAMALLLQSYYSETSVFKNRYLATTVSVTLQFLLCPNMPQ